MKMMQQGDAPLTGVCFFLHLMRRNQAVSHERPSDYPSQVSARTRIWKCVCRVSATLPKKKKKKKMYVFFFFPNFFLKQNPFYTWVEIIFGSGEQIITLRLIYVVCSVPTLSESGLD